jgi:tRNA(Ile2) C34 agmatinyltransferase TiaS
MNPQSIGVMRCIIESCGGSLGSSGKEVTRLECSKCGQNYQVCVYLKPIDNKPELALPPPVERAE